MRWLISFLLLLCLNASATTNWIVFLGNSIGISPDTSSNYPQFTITNLGNPWGMTNLCVSGYTSQDINDNRLTGAGNAFAQSLPSANRNLVHLLEGGNSLYFSNAANASLLADIAFKDLTNVCARVRTNGQFIIVGTIPGRADLLSDSLKASALTNLNILISNQWASFADSVVFYHTNILLDPIATPSSYDGGGIHPVAAGAVAYADQLSAFLRLIIPIRIGSGALVPLLSGLNYRGTVGDSPDDGAIETLNPPLFHWIYMETPWVESAWWGGAPRTFNLQLSTNNFTGTNWNFATSNNFLNTLPPITNADGSMWAGSNWWRVVYYNSNHTAIVSTSAVHHFKLSSTASNWDRSMLSDSNYLYSKLSPHPHLFFPAASNTAALSLLNTGFVGRGWINWTNFTNYSIGIVTNTWWTNFNVLTNSGYTHLLMSLASLTYVVDSNAVIGAKDPALMMDMYATWWNTDPFWIRGNTGTYEHEPEAVYALPVMYDSFYNLATSLQRSNMLYAMECSVARYLGYSWWFTGAWDLPTGTNGITYGTALMYPQGAGKGGYSHQRVDVSAGLLMCMAGWAESAFLREAWPYFINYVLGYKEPSNLGDGRGYNYSFGWNPSKEGIPEMISIWNFPEAQLQRNPIYQEFANFFAYWGPLHYRANGQAWGDYGYGIGWTQPLDSTDERFHYWSRILNHGALYKQWYLESGPSSSLWNLGDQPFFAACTFNFPVPAQSNWTDNSYVDLHRGYAMINSKQPADHESFSNTVAFITRASPGVISDHHSAGEGGLEMWAYGARVTAHGDGQSKHGMAQWGMTFVDGYGPFNVSHGWTMTNILSRITSLTNNDAFAYVASDTTEAYNKHYVNDLGIYDVVFERGGYRTNKQYYLTSTKRHFLFPHKKYLVLYDTMTTSTNAVFQKLFHYMEPTGTVNTNGCSFTYTVTNHFHSSNVTVYVTPFVNSTLMSLTNLPGTTNYYVNPWTGETNIDTHQSYDPPWPEGHIWVYNQTPTTNWHFGFVVYPKRWDEPSPTITRLDDYTVKVAGYTNDGSAYPGNWVAFTDTNTFDTNYASAFTFMVDAGATNAPPSPPPPPPNLIQASKGAGKMKFSGKGKGQ